MAQPTDSDELTVGWRALSGSATTDGWRAIRTTAAGPCSVFAARRFPGNEEAVIIGFPNVRIPAANQLPQSRGFAVYEADFQVEGPDRSWVALARQPAGSLDFFAMMARDVLAVISSNAEVAEDRLFSVFLRRVTAWQDFMQRARDGVLSAEAEIGLFGELLILSEILKSETPPLAVLNGWEGPIDGLQDFVFGAGAIEVKSTIASEGFPAKIGSLEQLDNSAKQPLFLAGVRLAVGPIGQSLPQQIAVIREQLEGSARELFDSRLVHAGYLDALEAEYSRMLVHVETKLRLVDEDFPRLTPALVGPAIRSARYELDLDLVNGSVVKLSDALSELDVI
jgi:hypothetical protein